MEVNGKNLNIQGGSPEDPGSLPEEAVQKEIEALAREAAARGIIEAARIEAGEALMKILEETPVKEKRSRETEDKEKADSAELSNESLAYNRRAEEEADRQRELERLLSNLWKLFEEWQPQPGLGLEQELSQLNAAYQKLLQEILRLYTQAQAGTQTDRINTLLLEIIQKMSHERFPAFLELLSQYGKKGEEDLLIASVFGKVTGRTVSPQEVGAARARKEMAERQESGAKEKKGGSLDALGPERGILYRRGRGNQIGANERYREKVQAQEQLHLKGDGKAGIPDAGRLSLGGKMYSMGDIELGEQFLRYMKGEGNLYSHSGITAVNEELLGFLMALNMAKVRIFTEYSGVGKGMASDIQDMMERFFRHCLEQAVKTQAAREGAGGRKAPDSRSIQQMYYRALELIQCMKTPEKGVWKGLQYAWEIFLGKKEEEEYSVLKRYDRNAGFFLDALGDKDRQSELLYGAELLDRDWRKFLVSMGQDGNALLQMMLTNCPWGALAQPEEDTGAGTKRGAPGGILLIGTGLCILLALAALVFRGGIF